MVQDRLSSYATLCTVAIMFVAITWVAPVLQTLQPRHAALGVLAGVLASFGVYRLVADCLMMLFRNTLWIRKKILGRSFLEGTWIGHYERGGKHFYTIENVYQDSGSTVILGREFSEDGATRAKWFSGSSSIDLRKMELTYEYTCSVFETKHVQEGIGVFRLVCETGPTPNKLDGYSVDVIDGSRDPNVELKLADHEIPDELALQAARLRFKPSSAPAMEIS